MCMWFVCVQEQEDEAFRGLLFLGGRDSQGRPVVIINTDAIPAGHNSAPRDAALAYLLKRLSPVVTRVRVKAGWRRPATRASAYRSICLRFASLRVCLMSGSDHAVVSVAVIWSGCGAPQFQGWLWIPFSPSAAAGMGCTEFATWP